MAISTINYDKNNNPTRSKYRIIVLENLNNNDWGKCDTYAPVLNQTETRLQCHSPAYQSMGVSPIV